MEAALRDNDSKAVSVVRFSSLTEKVKEAVVGASTVEGSSVLMR